MAIWDAVTSRIQTLHASVFRARYSGGMKAWDFEHLLGRAGDGAPMLDELQHLERSGEWDLLFDRASEVIELCDFGRSEAGERRAAVMALKTAAERFQQTALERSSANSAAKPVYLTAEQREREEERRKRDEERLRAAKDFRRWAASAPDRTRAGGGPSVRRDDGTWK